MITMNSTHFLFLFIYSDTNKDEAKAKKKRSEKKNSITKSITPLVASRQCGQPSFLNPVSRFDCTKKNSNNKGKENEMKSKSRRYRRGRNAEAEAQYDLNSKNYSDPVG